MNLTIQELTCRLIKRDVAILSDGSALSGLATRSQL